MDIVALMKSGTPAECREAGELLISLADMPRDAAYAGILETVAAKFRSEGDDNIVAVYERMKRRQFKWRDAMWRDGMSHSQLLKAELERRGDPRTEREYVDAICGEQSYLVSDVGEALKALR